MFSSSVPCLTYWPKWSQKPTAVCVCLVTRSCLTLCDLMDYIARLLRPCRFSRPGSWSGLPCPPPGDLPNPGIKPRSPTLQADSLPSEPPGKPKTGLSNSNLYPQCLELGNCSYMFVKNVKMEWKILNHFYSHSDDCKQYSECWNSVSFHFADIFLASSP